MGGNSFTFVFCKFMFGSPRIGIQLHRKIHHTDPEQKLGGSIQGFEFPRFALAGFQWLAVGDNHLALRHDSVMQLDALDCVGIEQELEFAFGHCCFLLLPAKQRDFACP